MELTMDITWLSLLLGITSCVIGYFALNPMLYSPANRGILIQIMQLTDTTQNDQLNPNIIQFLGYIRRRRHSYKIKQFLVPANEEAPSNPLLPHAESTITREEIQCQPGSIQSPLYCSRYSPSSSSLPMTGV